MLRLRSRCVRELETCHPLRVGGCARECSSRVNAEKAGNPEVASRAAPKQPLFRTDSGLAFNHLKFGGSRGSSALIQGFYSHGADISGSRHGAVDARRHHQSPWFTSRLQQPDDLRKRAGRDQRLHADGLQDYRCQPEGLPRVRPDAGLISRRAFVKSLPAK